jgi:predicted enzyme related to lactoylglutathione lyase
MKFAGVCLIAEHTPTLAGFYEELLGETGQWEGDDHVTFPCANLAIFSVRGMEEMAPGSMKNAGAGKAVLSFDVADADEALEKLQSLGAGIVMPPRTHPWGLRSLWARDPEGNLLSLRSPAKA